MPDFLLELLTEEIPARMQAAAAAQLAARFTAGIAGQLAVERVDTFVTPRRLILHARGLAAQGEATAEERRGPRADAPAAALDGFLRSTGLTREQLEERDTPKGRFLYATIRSAGRAASEVIAALIPDIVRDFDWPKSMRWGEASLSTASPRWVRPLTSIVALLDDAVVPFAAAGIRSGRTTRGHRFMSTGVIEIASAATYADQLRAAHVLIDASERARIIAEGARAAATAAGLTLIDDAGLIAENAGLTEWPVALLGRFDPAFLDVPREVIVLTMRTNQKYFACTEAGGALAPAFVCVAGLAAPDGGAAIVAGNEKVLSARLADAKFFWDADLQRVREGGLASFTPKLETIVFHEKLGTLADKVERVAKLARWLVESGAVKPHGKEGDEPSSRHSGEGRNPAASQTPTIESETQLGSGLRRNDEEEKAALAQLAYDAARLCKADLVSATVGEFPEVQGIAGRYLALAEGLDPQVADAIRDHYKPVGPSDMVPTAPVSVAVALADKLDTLCQFFDRGIRPTGSKDPFALRRAALGVVRLILANDLNFSLREAFWVQPHSSTFGVSMFETREFFVERLAVQQREQGIKGDLVQAVFALGDEELNLVRLLARVRALQAFIGTDDGANLLAGYKRAANILRIEEAKDGPHDGAVDAGLLTDPSEQALAAALDTALPAAADAVAREDFADAMTALSTLRAPVDAFFEAVMVNADDAAVRRNRLALLARLRAAVHAVADFSKIEG